MAAPARNRFAQFRTTPEPIDADRVRAKTSAIGS